MLATTDSTQTEARDAVVRSTRPSRPVGLHAGWTSAFALGFALATTAAVNTASGQSLTLADALRQALRADNPALQQQDDTVAGAAGRVREAKGAFDWTTSVQGGWQQLYVPTPTKAGLLTNQTSTVSSYYYSANIGRKFRNGVEVAPGVTAYPGAGATPAQTSGLTQIRPALGLKIPLLRGSGQQSVDAPERGAADSLDSARQSQAFAMQQLAQGVAATFWRCIADDQILQETQATDQHSTAYQSKLAKLVQQGLLEPTVAQQWTANNVVQHLNVDRANDEAQRCRRDLAYALTGSSNEPWPAASGELPDVESLSLALGQLNDQAMVNVALDQRQDLGAASGNVRAARENVRVAKDSARSDLSIHLDPDRAIVSFTKSFGNNIAKGKEAEASAAEDQASLTLRQLQDQVRDQVSDAILNLKRSASDWAALDGAEKQMEVVVSDAEKRAQFGSINWSDYLSAQNQLSQLRQQVINARLTFAVNLSGLRLATGTIDPDRPLSLAADMAKLPTPQSP